MTLLEFLVAMKWPLTIVLIVLVVAIAAASNHRAEVAADKQVRECKGKPKEKEAEPVKAE